MHREVGFNSHHNLWKFFSFYRNCSTALLGYLSAYLSTSFSAYNNFSVLILLGRPRGGFIPSPIPSESIVRIAEEQFTSNNLQCMTLKLNLSGTIKQVNK